jgi:hypothetical protein
MERRRSLGNARMGQVPHVQRPAGQLGGREKPRRSAVNFPGNLRFHPIVAFKSSSTSEEMELRKEMLAEHAVIIEEGSLSVRSTKEVKDILLHHFGIHKHKCYVYHSYPKPFTAIFPNSHARDLVFDAARVIDGPIELAFHAWNLDQFGDRENIPYHVRLCTEGIPHHA